MFYLQVFFLWRRDETYTCFKVLNMLRELRNSDVGLTCNTIDPNVETRKAAAITITPYPQTTKNRPIFR